jgi:hypothetical protein
MTLQPNLESQEESEVAESEIWIWLWMGKGQNVILHKEQLQCQGGVTRNIMVKDPFLHLKAFLFTKQHPSNASTLRYKKMSLCSSPQGQTHTPPHPSLHCSSKLMVCHYTPNLPLTWPHLIGGITCTQPTSQSFISIYTVLTLTSVSPADIPSLNKKQLTYHFSNSDTATRTHPLHG